MRFRQKPIEIDAVQWFPPGDSQHVKGVFEIHPNPRGERTVGEIYDMTYAYAGVYHLSIEGGCVELRPSDWIVTGASGEKHVCKPDAFAATYEPTETC